MRRVEKFILLCFIALYSASGWGQNLVPNPSFEEYEECITDHVIINGNYIKSELLVIPDWQEMDIRTNTKIINPTLNYILRPQHRGSRDSVFLFYCKGEKQTFFEDVYNSGLPQPLSGDLMLYSYRNHSVNTSIITNLTSTLQKDSVYKLEFYIRSTPYTYYTTDNFGWYSSPTKVDTTVWELEISNFLDTNYTVFQSQAGSRLSSMDTWTKVTSCYQAEGDEKSLYFSVNFPYKKDSFLISKHYTDNRKESLRHFLENAPSWINSEGGPFNYIYYAVDSISLVQVPYDPIILDTLTYCVESPVWKLDSADIERGEILCRHDLEYSWSDGTQALYRTFPGTGKYTLSTTSQCGEHTFIFTVEEKQCEENIYIPTAFTPNADGINDTFKPLGTNFSAISLSIYDKYGALIYKGRPGKLTWNGKHRGITVSEGVYAYKFKYETPLGEKKIKHGTVTVMR